MSKATFALAEFRNMVERSNDSFLVIVSNKFMVDNYMIIETFPKRVTFQADDEVVKECIRSEIGPDVPFEVVADAMQIVNETQFKKHIEGAIMTGLFRDKIPKIPGRSIRPFGESK